MLRRNPGSRKQMAGQLPEVRRKLQNVVVQNGKNEERARLPERIRSALQITVLYVLCRQKDLCIGEAWSRQLRWRIEWLELFGRLLQKGKSRYVRDCSARHLLWFQGHICWGASWSQNLWQPIGRRRRHSVPGRWWGLSNHPRWRVAQSLEVGREKAKNWAAEEPNTGARLLRHLSGSDDALLVFHSLRYSVLHGPLFLFHRHDVLYQKEFCCLGRDG